jgi:hypothetical protein
MKHNAQKKIGFKDIIRYISHNFQNNDDTYVVKSQVEIAKVLTEFMKHKGKSPDEITERLYERFEIYRKKYGFVNSYIHLKKLVLRQSDREGIRRSSFQYISGLPVKYRLFLLYGLIDVAAEDHLLEKNERGFIETVRSHINIPKTTLNTVFSSYFNKGLQDEEQLKAEAHRKKALENWAASFVPSRAYKIMGLSASVGLSELKKKYRKLAKKYHPDKFHGKSEAVIQEAEEKFQEITKAYEIIELHLKSKT